MSFLRPSRSRPRGCPKPPAHPGGEDGACPRPAGAGCAPPRLPASEHRSSDLSCHTVATSRIAREPCGRPMNRGASGEVNPPYPFWSRQEATDRPPSPCRLHPCARTSAHPEPSPRLSPSSSAVPSLLGEKMSTSSNERGSLCLVIISWTGHLKRGTRRTGMCGARAAVAAVPASPCCRRAAAAGPGPTSTADGAAGLPAPPPRSQGL